ncbi:MAG: hypothetical protein ACP5MB_10280 [bacterium]
MGKTNRSQRLSGLMRYLLLPVIILSMAILLSRCGKAPTQAPAYHGPVLVGAAKVNINPGSAQPMTIENFVPPSVTPPRGGQSFSVSIWNASTVWLTGSTIAGWVTMTNQSANATLTGVVVTAQTGPSTMTILNADYGNGFWSQNPSQGPWTWWFYKGTSPNFNLPVGSTSNPKLWQFSNSVAGNYSFYVYIWAFCPSGVVVDRTNNNSAISPAFVMLGNFPGDQNYWTQNIQGAGYTGNYLTATDANGYFALPVTTVVGSYITYTAGGLSNQSATNATYDNFTVWGTGFSYVVLPLRKRTNYSSYVAVGSTNGGSDVNNPTNLANGCGNNAIPIGLMVPFMSFNDLINLSLSSLVGPNLSKTLYGDTTCAGTYSSTNLNLPSNIIVPAANIGNLNIYTSSSGSTSIYAQTITPAPQGKNYYVPAPQNSTFSMAGLAGNIPYSTMTQLSYVLQQPGAPVNFTSLLQSITFKSFGARTGIAVGTANIGSGVSPNINNNIGATPYTLNLGNTTSIWGPQDPTNQTYNLLGLTGVYYSTNPVDFQLTTQALASGTTGATSIALPYVSLGTAGPTFIPAVIITDLGRVNANFSATTAIAYRTGSTGSPAVPAAFNYWYKFMDLNWPTINPNDQQVSWTSAANSGVQLTAPTIGLADIVYDTNFNYTGLDSSAQTATVLATAWEMVMNPNVTAIKIPTLPINSAGLLLTQPAYGRFYTVKLLQGLARTSVNGPVYSWDSTNNFATVMNNYILGAMDVFSLTSFPVGGAWIIQPANNASGIGTAPAAKAYINAYNWKIVSGGTPANLRGCFYVSVGSTPYWSNCTTGSTNCAGLPAITVASPYAYQTATLSLSSGVYNSITFTPYNTTALSTAPSDGSPACQQVGESDKISVHP